MTGLKTLIFACGLVAIRAFVPLVYVTPSTDTSTALDAVVSRRSLLTNSALVGVGWMLKNSPAVASGGATAGGAYLLSAKQRYNDRVQSSMKAFYGLKKSLESGSVDDVATYFSTEASGGWKDGSSAGYLLANAFRRTSTTPPDSLPSVKKWKAFAAEVESVMKAAKKKDAAKTLALLEAALPTLDSYLELVELPPVKDL